MVNVGSFFSFFRRLPFFNTPPRGTNRKRTKSKTCCTNGPRPNFFFSQATLWNRAKFPDTPLYRSSTDFCLFFPSRHLVAQDETSWHTALSVNDRFFFFVFFHATSWHRAKFPDSPLYRSPTDFFLFLFLSRHLVAKSRSPQHTAQSVPDRFLLFFTPPRGTEQKSTTHCLNGPHNYVARQTNRCKQHK